MSSFNPPPSFTNLSDYIEAVQLNYEACLAHVEHPYVIDGVEGTIRLHYVKFTPNGEPKFDALASALVDHITYYCISAKKRSGPLPPHVSNRLFIEARDMFRVVSDSGELGELLLFFLQEAVLDAPQVLCKMELKTNRKDEVKGADGVHINWNYEKGCLNLFIGESKLYQNLGQAIKSVLKSIDTLHSEKKLQQEISLVTSHFKYLDEDLRERVVAYLDEKNPEGSVNIAHACLIGFDWTKYKNLLGPNRSEFIKSFEEIYREHGKNIATKLNGLFSEFKHKNYTYEFFFIPFSSVQDFRDEFYRQLVGSAYTRADESA